MSILTLKQCSERTGLTVSRLNDLCISGELPAETFGKSWAVKVTDLTAFVDANNNVIDSRRELVEARARVRRLFATIAAKARTASIQDVRAVESDILGLIARIPDPAEGENNVVFGRPPKKLTNIKPDAASEQKGE